MPSLDERLEIRLSNQLMVEWAQAVPPGQGAGLIRDFMEKVVVKLYGAPDKLVPLLHGEYLLSIRNEEEEWV